MSSIIKIQTENDNGLYLMTGGMMVAVVAGYAGRLKVAGIGLLAFTGGYVWEVVSNT
jgi:hypothetical protein